MRVVLDALAEGGQLRLRLGAAARDALVLLELQRVVLVLLRVLRFFRHREIGELGHEHVGAERRGDFFLQRVELVQVGRENHEADVGPREHGAGDDLGLRLLAREVDEGLQVIERGGLLLVRDGAPGGKIDAVKKMERAEALLGAQRLGGIGGVCVWVGHTPTVI